MDPTTIAASVVTLLAPVAKKALEAFAGEGGKAAFAKGQELLGRLRKRFGGDPVFSGMLERFEHDPDQWGSTLQGLLAEKAAADEEFRAEMAARIAELESAAPQVAVVQRMKRARGVIGVEAEGLDAGSIDVEQTMDDAEGVTGVRLGHVGRPRRAGT